MNQDELRTLRSLDATHGDWCSHLLKSDREFPVEDGWISIPAKVWHQAVVPGENWVVISFHTAAEHELIDERPAAETAHACQRRKCGEG